MDLEEARRRIREHKDLNAFIAISTEIGIGTVVAVKDLVDVAGMVTTAGAIILPDTPAGEDAPVVTQIRSHGCVLAGKANLPKFPFWVTTVKPPYGPARNPHPPRPVAAASAAAS